MLRFVQSSYSCPNGLPRFHSAALNLYFILTWVWIVNGFCRRPYVINFEFFTHRTTKDGVTWKPQVLTKCDASGSLTGIFVEGLPSVYVQVLSSWCLLRNMSKWLSGVLLKRSTMRSDWGCSGVVIVFVFLVPQTPSVTLMIQSFSLTKWNCMGTLEFRESKVPRQNFHYSF